MTAKTLVKPCALLLAVFCISAVLCAAAVAQTHEPGSFRAAPGLNKYAVIITGPTVGERNEAKFRGWSRSLYEILLRDYGYSADTVTLLYGRGDEGRFVDAAADAAGIRAAFASLSERAAAGEQITLFLLGHGSDDGDMSMGLGDSAKFNIAGPDLSGTQFNRLLDEFRQQDVVIINTTSASYGFSAALAAQGRVVISATRSAAERFDPVFASYFIEALDGRQGDRDKNQRVSLLEAFHYAKAGVAGWYEEQGRLASEHAGLDDNGDGRFSLNPAAAGEEDGGLAEIVYLDSGASSGSRLRGQAAVLAARMEALEREVFLLRGRKGEFLEDEYWQQMQVLLVDLAQTTEQFDALR